MARELRNKIEEGQIRRARVLYREAITANPKEVGNIGNNIIVIRFGVTDTMSSDTLRKIHLRNIDSVTGDKVIFSNVKNVPISRGRALTGVYAINRGFIGVLNMYKVSTLISPFGISPDFEFPQWYVDHLDRIKDESEGSFVEVPAPINEEI